MIDEHLDAVERLRRDGAVVLLKWDGEKILEGLHRCDPASAV